MPRGAVTASEELSARYNGFFSYRSPYRFAAKRLERALHAIASRHDDHDGFRIFLDTSDLKPGPLRENVYGALRRSNYLVVLIDGATATSQWVSDEIAYWLDKGGARDRLYLVRVDRKANLGWRNGRFEDSTSIPEPLRDLFQDEPKWIDFSGWGLFGRRENGLPGLGAALMEADPAEFGLVEAENQRRRARTRTLLTGAMAFLLVIATVAAIVAVDNERRAAENEDQALAQADSAEALLAADNSPTLAIERALRAASRSDSPTVRSALLAVSQTARRLRRAVIYPELDTGHSADDARFSSDGTTLVAWGRDRTAGTSRVQAWNVPTGAVIASTTVHALDLYNVALVGNQFVAACSASGPVLVDLSAGSTTGLDRGWRDEHGLVCDVREFDGGAVLLAADSTGDGSAHVVGRNGEVLTTDGATSIAVHPFARSAVLAGPAGVVLVTADSETQVSTRPGGVAEFADAVGNFLVAWGPLEWGVVTQGPAGPTIRALAVSAGAVDVSPVLDAGRMTGELAWITGDGMVGWTADGTGARVENAQGEPGWIPYGTRLEPLAYQQFVAVYRNTAIVVLTPGSLPLDGPPLTTDWTQSVIEARLGAPEQSGDEPVLARCAGHDAVLLATDLPEGGSLLVGDYGESRRLAGRGSFTDSCQAIDISGSLTTVPGLGSLEVPGVNERVELRSTLIADAVAVSPAGDQVAIVKSGFPIEILSTLPPNELPRPWDVTTGRGGVVSALGERELFIEGDLVIADGAGVVGRVRLPEVTDIEAVRPDGTGAAIAVLRPGPARILLAGEHGVEPAHAECQEPVTYLPGIEFARSLTAAEAQIPVAVGETGFVDCRDGRAVPWEPGHQVLSYDVGKNIGRIVTRTDDAVTVTTWTRGDASSLRTMQGPPLPPAGGAVSFDPGGQMALTYPINGRRLTLYRNEGDRWLEALSLATVLPGVVDAQVVDAGTLVLAVSAEGGFELFDVATGRLVASDPGLTASYEPVVGGFSARRVGDDLFVVLETTSLNASATVRIPVGIPALKRQLCSLYPADDCDR